MAAKLREDQLLHMQVRQELRHYDGRQISRTYYYLDLAHFVDVTTFRLYRMRRTLEEQASSQASDRAYYCVACKRQYGLLDVTRLLSPLTQAFECEICHGELQSVDGGVYGASSGGGGGNSGSSALLATKLTEQTHDILRLLRRLEGITLPPFDPVEHLKHSEAFDLFPESLAAASGHVGASGENVSISSHGSAGVEASAIGELEVELVDPLAKKPGSTIVHELPSWHTHSTVTGMQVRPASSTDPRRTTNVTGSGVSPPTATMISEPGQLGDYQSYYEERAKRAKAESVTEGMDTTMATSPGIAPSTLGDIADDDKVQAGTSPEAVIMVMVQGEAKDIHSITEEDKDRMTEEEYINYYTAYESL